MQHVLRSAAAAHASATLLNNNPHTHAAVTTAVSLAADARRR
jgi:hypothetical protein